MFKKIRCFSILFVMCGLIMNAQTRDSILYFSNNSFQTTTDATGSNGDYIQLPSLGSLANGNFTVETWFKVVDRTRSFQRIFEAGTGQNNNVLSIGFDGTSGLLFVNGDRRVDTLNRVQDDVWHHVAMVKKNDSILTYLDGVFIDKYRFSNNSAILSTCKIGASNYNNASTIGQFQEFRIWNVARSVQDIQNNLRVKITNNSPNLIYYLPLNKSRIFQRLSIPNASKLMNASTAVGAIVDSAIVISQQNKGAQYFYDTTRQFLFGSLANNITAYDTLQFSIDGTLTWYNIETIIETNWVATIPENFRQGEVQVRIKNDLSRIFRSYVFTADTFYSKINTQVSHGSISANHTILSGYHYRVGYLGDYGYYVDSIYINGVYNEIATKDSLLGYTFNNVQDVETIRVVFNNGAKIKSVNKVLVKTGDTIIIRSPFLSSINLIHFKDTLGLHYRYKRKIALIDTNYFFVIPYCLKAKIYEIQGVRGDTTTKSTLLIRIYNFATDSIENISWGLNTNGQRNIAKLRNLVDIVGGRAFSLGLKQDGKVIGWGYNGSGQTNVPSTLNDVVQIAAGALFSLALKSDGTVVGWGSNSEHQLNVPSGLKDVIQIATGNSFCLALKSDGNVVSWGANSLPFIRVPSGLTNVIQIAAGYQHAVALRADSTVEVWGTNRPPKLNKPSNLKNVIQISSGYDHVLALKSDSTVVAWGSDGSGQTNIPVGLKNIVQVVAGEYHSLALTNDNLNNTYTTKIVGWGANADGQINSPLHLDYVVNMSSGPFANFNFAMNKISIKTSTNNGGVIRSTLFIKYGENVRITYKADSNYALDSVYINGVYNADVSRDSLVGYTFNNVDTTHSIKVIFTNRVYLKSISKVIVKTGDTFFIRSPFVTTLKLIHFKDTIILPYRYKRRVEVLDTNYFFVLPENMKAGIYRMQFIKGNSFTTNTMLLRIYNFATDSIENISWGLNKNGQRNIATLRNLIEIVGGSAFSLGLRKNGEVVGWGYNGEGQTNVPSTLKDVVQIAAGAIFSLALKSDGTLVGWGENNLGQLNFPANLNNVVQISSGRLASLALKTDGTVVGWGASGSQLIHIPANLNNVIQVANGYKHGMALKADSTVEVWGENGSGQLHNLPNLNKVIQIASGYGYCLALKSDSTVVVWGDNGGLAPPAGLKSVIQIVAGVNYALALTNNQANIPQSTKIIGWGDNSNGETSIPNDLNYVFNMSSSSTSNFSFAMNRLSIKTNANSGGIISNSFFVKFGDSVRITYSTNLGYAIDSVIINGMYNRNATSDSLSGYTFKNIDTTQTIRIKFRVIPTYNVTTTVFNGTISMGNVVDSNSLLQITYSPVKGFVLDSIFVNNRYIGIDSVNSYTIKKIRGDSSIRVIFKNQTFTITARAGEGGSISPQGDTIIKYDSNIQYNIVPDIGYLIDSVFVNDSFATSATNYRFDSVRANQMIRVTFKNQTFTITARAGEGGSISPQGDTIIKYDSNIQYNIVPDIGYLIDSVFVNDSFATTATNYRFDSVRANQTIRVTFKNKTFIITASAGMGGSISPQGDTIIKYDSSIVYVFTPDIGYLIDSVFVNDTFATTATNYRFDSVRVNQTIRVTFKNKIFIITARAGMGGSISPQGDTIIKYDSSIVYVFTPDIGYLIDSVFVNDTFATTATNYRFDSVRVNQTIRVTFKNKIFIITARAGIGGSISPQGDTLLDYGSNITYSILPNLGYDIDSILINGVVVTKQIQYIFNNIVSNQNIRVMFKRHSYFINYQNTEGGIIGFEGGVNKVFSGNDITCIIKAQDTFIIDSMVINGRVYQYLNGQNAGLDSLSYRFLNVTGDSSIIVYFKRVSPSSSPILLGALAGDKQAIVRFDIPTDWNGGTIVKYLVVATNASRDSFGSESPIIIKNLINNVRYQFIVFAINQWGMVSPASDTTDFILPHSNLENIYTKVINGTISEPTSINFSEDIVITYSPKLGYELDSIFINTKYVGLDSVNRYTFNNVSGDSSILVTYKLKTFLITALPSPHGSISPSGTTTVNYGNSISFNFIPDVGYLIDSVFVNDSFATTSNRYTFESVKSKQTIRATFKNQTFTITVSASIGGRIIPQGDTTIYYDSSIEYSFLPDVGYVIDSVFVNGIVVTKQIQYIFKNIVSNQNIRVVFKRHSYFINYQNNEGGNIGFEGGENRVLSGNDITCIIKAQDTFIIDSMVINGRLVYQYLNGQNAGLDSLSYRFLNVTGDSSIMVFFKRVVASSPPVLLGAIAGNGQAIVRFEPPMDWNGGSIVKYVVVSTHTSGETFGSESPIIISNLTNNTPYQFIVFAVNAWGMVSSPSDTSDFILPHSNLVNINTKVLNGTISEPTSINFNENVVITYSPKIGYELDSIFINTKYVGLDSVNRYTFNNVRGDSSILVTYKLKTFTITALATIHGSISPRGTSVVSYGKNVVYSIIPDEGYDLDSLFIDGVSVPKASQFTFTNLNSNRTIYATFKIKTFQLFISYGNNGFVSPAGLISVNFGTSFSCTFTPNKNYLIDSVIVNNINQSFTDSIYTFTNIQGDSSLRVTFKPRSISLNSISIIVTNPNCYGQTGAATVRFTDTTIYNKLFIRNTVSHSMDTFNLKGNQFVINNLYADTIYEVVVFDSQRYTDFQSRTFNIILKQPDKLNAFSQVEESGRTVSLHLSGSTRYVININGNTFKTTSNIVKLPLIPGVNKIIVKTEKDCEGVYEETILVSNKMSLYPNPASNVVTLNIGGDDLNVLLSLITEQGNYLFTKHVEIDDYRQVMLDISSYPSGVYILKVQGKFTQGTLKLIKQ
ncbi:MAG: T9SS type A sorting domain-containing protein [Alphaproteobacteria bacterium]|nr:T9SS type A sorting domain-containing protein [Alphaproteobacteria bacterium]